MPGISSLAEGVEIFDLNCERCESNNRSSPKALSDGSQGFDADLQRVGQKALHLSVPS